MCTFTHVDMHTHMHTYTYKYYEKSSACLYVSVPHLGHNFKCLVLYVVFWISDLRC